MLFMGNLRWKEYAYWLFRKGDFLPNDLISQEIDKWIFSMLILSGSSKNRGAFYLSPFWWLWYLDLPRQYDFIVLEFGWF